MKCSRIDDGDQRIKFLGAGQARAVNPKWKEAARLV